MKSLVSLRFPQEMPEKPCVFKLEAGKKFFIWKTLDLSNQKNFVKDLDRKIIQGCKDGDIFCKLATHMRSYRIHILHVTVLFSTDNIDELVDFERNELLKCQPDPDCVNILFEPYIGAKIAAMLKEPVKSIKSSETGNQLPKERSEPVSPKNNLEKEISPSKQSTPKKVLPEIEISGDEMPDFSSLLGALSDLKKS